VADNSPSSGGTGDTIASDDIGGIKYQRVKLVAGLDGVNDGDGSATTPYPTGLAATPFFPSANNSSSANLAPGQVFTGTIQANQNLPVISINVACDQPTRVTLYGSTDAAGLNQINPVVIPFVTSVSGYPVNAAIPGNTNYYWVTVQNVGYATTTKCVIDVGSGWLFPVTPLGNAPSAINEVNGVAVTNNVPVGLIDKASGISLGAGVNPLYIDSPYLKVETALRAVYTQMQQVSMQSGSGFYPVEIPSFLTAF
jgi:hypothetical protein